MKKKESKDMEKDKKKVKKKRAENYEKPLKINGTFEEAVKVLVKEEKKEEEGQ